ncbi:SDR family NAD(P)-dependent oxidoreductase [Devosia beringensis]|uniref:SDR family NAD(P)-dependent oxidoreductase n=1 Tax=Devosia beringensis TaxID=2657486 RepID=UPI00186B60E3|nr:SDR family NAD(P)-dependent oxidoreductase [Devosia beringensis]
MSLQPGVAWIIGGGSGIGAAVAQLLAKRGWTVAISGRREDKLAAVAQGHPTISGYPLDVTDGEAIAATVQKIAAELGRIDLFIFGAAAWQPMDVGDYDYDKFAKIVDTNYLGVLRVANPLLAQMDRQGGGHFSVIASVAGYFGLPRSAAYSSTKAGLINLLETMRTELAPRNITVRMIVPGFVKSELTDKNDFPMPFLMETADAAVRIVDGLTQSDRFEIAFPKRMVWLMKTVRWLPYPVFFWLTSKMLPKD